MRRAAILLLSAFSATVAAQDSITLFDCYRQAEEHAPRLEDREHIEKIGALRVDNLASNWYPSLDLNGKLSYQSDVVTIALDDPVIPVNFPEVPHDQYGLNLDVSQTLYDAGVTRRRKLYEQAQTAADLQQIDVDLYGLKEKVNRYFFPVLVLQENMKSLEIHMDDLERKRAVMEAAYREGTLLEADLKVMDVEILRVRKSMVEITAMKRSLMDALGILCGNVFPDEAILALPVLDGMTEEEGGRPELRWFDLKDASMESGKELASRQRMPVLFAFGQTGYGKPGYNMLSGEWDFYYMAGAGVRWNLWDWNGTRREIQVISSQQEILRNQRNSFEQQLALLGAQEEAKMEQYRKSMVLDEQVLVLQQEIAEDASAGVANGTMTVTEYLVELNKVNLTRISLATHRVQLIQSMAAYLTIQGIL